MPRAFPATPPNIASLAASPILFFPEAKEAMPVSSPTGPRNPKMPPPPTDPNILPNASNIHLSLILNILADVSLNYYRVVTL